MPTRREDLMPSSRPGSKDARPDGSQNSTTLFASLPWTEIAERLKSSRRCVALLPVGATEPHGPHLPLATDAIISVEAARRAAQRLEASGLTALVLPCIAYSVTDFSRDFPGAIGLSRETSLRMIEEIGRAALSHGFALLCLVNSHLEPDHLEVLRDASARIAAATGRPVVFPDKTQKRWASRLTAEFRSGACHAGQYESSLVLAAAPELVREDVMKGLPAVNISIGRKIKEGARSFKEAGGDDAYFGDPAAATRAEGDETYEILAGMVEEAVMEALGA